jgi:hypothetical protein
MQKLLESNDGGGDGAKLRIFNVEIQKYMQMNRIEK